MPSCSAVMRCNPPNNTFEDVSDPVSATPSQPIRVPKNGYARPVFASANPECCIGARVTRDEPNGHHAGDRNQRITNEVECSQVRARETGEAVAEKKAGEDRRDQVYRCLSQTID